MWLDKTYVESVRDRTDWAAILSRLGITGRAVRREYRACCPFHRDTRPSFYFELGRGVFYCHGCGCGGDGFALVMRLRGLRFPQAVQWVAEQGGPMPERWPGELLKELAEYYHQQLWRHEEAQSYLCGRGIRDRELWRACGLGYAPGGRCAQRFLEGRGYSVAQIREAGLLNRRGLDVLFRRVTLPIGDGSKVVNLYGRNLGSPFPHLYLPGRRDVILGWEGARVQTRGILVEGAFDWLTLRQWGYEEAITGLSAHLSARQIDQLGQAHWRELIVVFDHDRSGAGQTAAQGLANKLGAAGVAVRRVTLPAGCDVNDCLVHAHLTRSDFDDLLQGARSC